MKFIDDETESPLSEGTLFEDMSFWRNAFIESKETEKVASKTIKSYKDALESFLSFVKLHNEDNAMKNVGAKFINRYLIDYQASLATKKFTEQKISIDDYELAIAQQKEKFHGKNDAGFVVLECFENSIKHRLAVVKMLLTYISKNNTDEHDFTHIFYKLVKIRMKDKFMDYLTTDETDKVIDLMKKWNTEYINYKPKEKERYVYRESLLLLLYALTGARSAEVVRIRLRDVEELNIRGKEYYRIKIQEGKGSHIREVAVEKDFISPHIEYFKRVLPDDSYYLSSTSYADDNFLNKPHHQDNIRKFGNFVLQMLDINKSGLHAFRRAYATRRVVADGVDVAIVAKEMGNTTAILEKHYLKNDAAVNLAEKR